MSWSRRLHGHVLPRAADGATGPDEVQQYAVNGVIAFLDRYLKRTL